MLVDNFNEQVFEMIGRCRSRGSRAAAAAGAVVVGNGCQMIVSNNPARVGNKSKAASVPSQGINKMKAIHDFIASNGRV
jgi:hypothetical protein